MFSFSTFWPSHYKVGPGPPPLLSCLLLFRCQVAPLIRTHRRVHLWRKKKQEENKKKQRKKKKKESKKRTRTSRGRS
jgi:hypothetical protein